MLIDGNSSAIGLPLRNGVGERPVRNAAAQRTASELLEQIIRARAYEHYRARGAAPGSALEDWLQAEREFVGGESG
jgi:hypothetical protein